jgi:hypothetical protein
MTTRIRRPTPTQVRAARRRRQARRKRLLAIFGFSAAGLVAFLLILSLVLPGLPLDTLFRGGGSGDIFGRSASEAQEANAAEAGAQQAAPDQAAAPPLPPNPILGGVDIFYNCPDGCDDLVAQLSTIAEELDAADSPIGVTPKTDMEAKILLVGADANQALDAYDEAAIRTFIETNTAQ